MKNVFLVFSFIFLSSACMHAQTFMHSGGIGFHYLSVEDETGYNPGASILYGLAYEARLNVKDISDNMSVSVSSLPLAGIDLQFQAGVGGTGSFIVDIPVMVGLNFGYLATEESEAAIGGTINGGYGFAIGGASGYFSDSGGFIHGPVVNAGLRFNKKRDFGVSASFMPSMRADVKGMAIRLNILYQL
ncbi:MAG: hypothetical protein ACPGXZ_09865 [Saprospiraceae bacterium]|mgnify:CR=1 FL=1